MTTSTSAAELIRSLNLQPHPEGGWYSETWRAQPQDGGRASATSIYFLLDRGQHSHWHRVDAAEIWLWHAGSPVLLSTSPGNDGPIQNIILGGDVFAGQAPQHVIQPDHWQAAHASDDWALVSCIVSPGFEFEGFELAPIGWNPGAELRPTDDVGS
ncbi:MAG: cupin domain-containing protein [Sphingomonas sp.]|uniref:cupin domain-containing protein n=1 Tax=Sphingomonas sp. TaxID=28214 RepID=UPI00356924FC